ncbi:MAG: sigma-54 interaction domain-containing protein [Rickettsiales bacterium]
MTAPKLLLLIDDEAIASQLQKSKALQLFNAHKLALQSDWINTLHQSQADIAIIQADKLKQSQLDQLIEYNLLNTKDILFISHGLPNPCIDMAMRRGASYHLRLPLDIDFLNEIIDELFNEISANERPAEQVISSALDQFGLLVGSSPVMRKLYRIIRKSADTEANVLIVGESGAGKELVAQTVHLMSPRSEQPFVALNCGALSPELIESELFGHVKGAFTGANKSRAGVFEQAKGGTLFLDEVTEMPLDHQVKLLRVLETGEFRPVGSEQDCLADVRIIAATNREPSDAIQEESFREDLYFRLAHLPIYVPPLRDRGSDITGLAKHFLAYRNKEENTAKEISTDALEKIAQHNWPGNVRELKHAIERAYILADNTISESHLLFQEPTKTPTDATLPAGIPLEEVEKGVILKTLQQNEGNKTLTADQLGVSIKTLYNKLEKYREDYTDQAE